MAVGQKLSHRIFERLFLLCTLDIVVYKIVEKQFKLANKDECFSKIYLNKFSKNKISRVLTLLVQFFIIFKQHSKFFHPLLIFCSNHCY